LNTRPCWQEYAQGRTPNPCVLCNERIKFGTLLDFAHSLRAEYVATGHYARIDHVGDVSTLYRGLDRHKDQSYFLFSLNRKQLESALMPLGEFTKTAVREMARQRGLASADRKESQDVCLSAADAGFGEYLRRLFGGQCQSGDVVDSDGRVVGRHHGIHHFTIGQRRGAGIALGTPAWVKTIDATTGTITLTTKEQALLAAGLVAGGLVWHGDPPAACPLACQVQVRYRQVPVAAVVMPRADGMADVVLEQPVRAVTPGQAIVFYRDDRVVGGGWINRVLAAPDDVPAQG
jgi:tRNA-specific 2-thiouridylase